MMHDVYTQDLELNLKLHLFFLIKATLNSLTLGCVRNPSTTAASHTPSVAPSSTCEYLFRLKYNRSIVHDILVMVEFAEVFQ